MSERLKRIFCAALAAIMMITSTGVTVLAGELRDTVRQKQSSEVGDPSVSPSEENTQPEAAPGSYLRESDPILPMDESAQTHTMTLAASGENSFSAHLQKMMPGFTLATSSSESIDISGGSLCQSYPLFTMSGIGGMDLSLALQYSSADSNIREKYYDKDNFSHYFIQVGNAEWTYSQSGSLLSSHIIVSEEILFDNREEFERCMDEYVAQTRGGVLNDGAGGYVQYLDFGIIEAGGYIDMEDDSSLKKPNPTRTKLAPGWTFSIPNLEIIQYYEETANSYTSYKLITLDTGEKFRVRGTQFIDRKTTDITFSESTRSIGERTAAYLLNKANGLCWYFDENGLALRKEDRFGNGITYEYTGTGTNAVLSAIRDDTGRAITLSYETTETGSVITVSAPDGSTVEIGLSGNSYENRTLSSIDYGEEEIYCFSYTIGEGTVQQRYAWQSIKEENEDPPSVSLSYALLTDVHMPNGDTSEYTYQPVRSSALNAQIGSFRLVSRCDRIGGTVMNEISYSYSGDQYYANFCHLTGLTIEYYYETTVTAGENKTTYTFNKYGLCTRERTKNGETVWHEKTTEYLANRLPGTITEKDYGSGSVWYTTKTDSYTYNNQGSVLTHTDSKGNVTTTTYGAYQTPLTVTYLQNDSTTIVEENTLTSDNKSILRTEIRSNGNTVYKAEYTYDSHGNKLTEKQYILPGTGFAQTQYSYEDNLTRPDGINLSGVFLTELSVSGIKNADGVSVSPITETYRYDLFGRKIRAVDGDGYATQTEYDARGRTVKTIYPDGTEELYIYDLEQNITRHTDRAGWITETKYDGLGNLRTISDYTSGTILESRTYDARGRLFSIDHHNTSTVSGKTVYTYDILGRPLSVKTLDRADHTVSEETYRYRIVKEGNTYLFETQKTVSGDANAPSIITREYTDEAGLLIRSERDAYPHVWKDFFQYDYKGNRITESFASGVLYTYTYDWAGRVLTKEDALGNITTTAYNSLGCALSVTDPKGAVTENTYDVLGRLLTSASPVEKQNGILYRKLTKYAYDARGNITEKKVSNGLPGGTASYTRTVNTYDSMSRLTATHNYDGTGAALVCLYTYNAHDKVLVSNAGGVITAYTYDVRGRLTSVEDGLGSCETYTYDDGDRLISKTDRNGTLFTYTYDAMDRILTETAVRTGMPTQIKSYTYTKTGAIHTLSDGTVSITRRYDACGNLIMEKETADASVSISKYRYNAGGQPESYKLWINGILRTYETYAYDQMMRLTNVYTTVSVSAYDGNSYTVADSDGNIVFSYSLEEDPSAHTGNYLQVAERLYRIDFDASDITMTVSKTTGNYTGCFVIHATPDDTYLFTDMPQNPTEHAIVSWYYVYDKNGNVINTVGLGSYDSIFDGTTLYVADGYLAPNATVYTGASMPGADVQTLVVTYAYDACGNRTSLVYANGTSTEYTYNLAGLVTSSLHKKGETALSGQDYTYYLDGNVHTVRERSAEDFILLPEPEPEPEPEPGNSFTVRNGNSIVHAFYLVDDTDSIAPGIRYTVGNTTSRVIFTAGSAVDLDLSYTGQITKSGSYYSGSYTLQPFPDASMEEWENSLIETIPSNRVIPNLYVVYYVHDAEGNIVQTAAIEESADPAYINVVYLADGKVNVTSSSRAASLMAVEESQVEPQEERGKLTTYVYDGLGRLKSETIVDSSDTDVISYTYDAAGNRATMTRNGIVTTYTYDANNRMTAEQTGTNVKTFLYDANGNQLSALFNFNFAGAYTYDLFGRQISYTPDEVGFTYYTYRPDDLRHSIGNTVHVWSGTNIVADIKGGTTTVYFRGIGLIFAETSGTRTYYHQNAHGDVIMLTDGTGTILTTYEYDAFGREWDSLDSDNNPFRYCGEYFDKQTKTIYLRARYYDSAYGRFTQQDGWQYADVNDPLSLNLYTYCWNNPVNMVDPSGHLPKWLKKAAAIVATVAVAAAVITAVVATGGAAAAAVGMGVGLWCGGSTAVAATVTTVATVGVYVVAGTVGAIAISDSIEIATADNSGDGYNPIRDTVMGGNQETYDMFKTGVNVAAYGTIELGLSNSVSSIENRNSADDDSLAYDQYWSNKASSYGTPNTRIEHYRMDPTTQNIEHSTVNYDYAGRQSFRIDWTDHLRPEVHGNPHVHYRQYGAGYDPIYGKEIVLN